jgi:tetratricopeptide (TPR) repeat protein
VDSADLIFIDTETTGLVGGAGTVAFLIGLGTYAGGNFRIRQFFLRNPGEEHSMLRALQDEFQAQLGFVSFNGRTFDLPLLDMRFRIGLRESLKLSRWPQMDLLHPARRLWRRKLPDCSLGTIEREILGIQRSDQDVPGAQIPGMYLDYLRTGDTDGIQRVIYHNEIDILSMVSLTAEILSQHQSAEFQQDSGAEALGVAGWHLGAGRLEAAEAAYRAAAESPDPEIKIEAYRRISEHLKRTGRRNQAVEYWISWHELAPEDLRPCIELAMFYEWEARDLEEAKTWAQKALICLSHWPEDWRREKAWSEITHRLSRLDRKLNR